MRGTGSATTNLFSLSLSPLCEELGGVKRLIVLYGRDDEVDGGEDEKKYTKYNRDDLSRHTVLLIKRVLLTRCFNLCMYRIFNPIKNYGDDPATCQQQE